MPQPCPAVSPDQTKRTSRLATGGVQKLHATGSLASLWSARSTITTREHALTGRQAREINLAVKSLSSSAAGPRTRRASRKRSVVAHSTIMRAGRSARAQMIARSSARSPLWHTAWQPRARALAPVIGAASPDARLPGSSGPAISQRRPEPSVSAASGWSVLGLDRLVAMAALPGRFLDRVLSSVSCTLLRQPRPDASRPEPLATRSLMLLGRLTRQTGRNLAGSLAVTPYGRDSWTGFLLPPDRRTPASVGAPCRCRPRLRLEVGSRARSVRSRRRSSG